MRAHRVDAHDGIGGPQAKQLIDLARSRAELFHTPAQEPYASVLSGTHRETWRIDSKEFGRWLGGVYFAAHHRPPQRQALLDATNTLEGLSVYEGPTMAVHVRVAVHGDAVYIDLGDSEWKVVEVTPGGWKVTDEPPVKFSRLSGAEALPFPAQGGAIDDLQTFVNIADNPSFHLLVAWLVAALYPRGPYPILVLQGEQGSAKSTTARILRALTDPNRVPLRRLPGNERDFMISATNSRVLAFDNLSGLGEMHADILCCLATGAGFATRQLYTNQGEILFEATRPVILNGIDAVAARGDLLERALVLHLPTIQPEARRDERTFWADFDSVAPAVFGALLDALAGALSERPNVHLHHAPRMADFAILGTAVGKALGWGSGTFIDAFEGNRIDTVEASIEGDAIAVPLRRLAENHPSGWVGTATMLLRVLGDLAEVDMVRSRDWPASPQKLSVALRRLAPGLRHAAWAEVSFRRSASCRLIEVKPVTGVIRVTEPTVDGDQRMTGNMTQPIAPAASPSYEVPLQMAIPDANDANDAPINPVERRTHHPLDEDRFLKEFAKEFNAVEIYGEWR